MRTDKPQQRCSILRLFALATLACALLLPTRVVAKDELRQGFILPPDPAKPRAWWHWMNGNVTKAGIEADLEWMRRIGIGGLHTTDAGLNTPVVVDAPVPYGSAPWRDAFGYAADLADSLGLEFGIFSSPGWSLTGGPWVAPAQAMKKLVWSRLEVPGGKRFAGRLPELPRTTGPFQHMASTAATLISDPAHPLPEHGGDTIVLAYRVPPADSGAHHESAVVTSSAGPIDYAALVDDDSGTAAELALDGKPARVDIDFGEALEIRSATVSAGPPLTVVRLSASIDGRKYRPVRVFYMGPNAHTTVSFEPLKARFFRFTINVSKARLPGWDATAVPGASDQAVRELFPLRPDATRVEVRELALRQVARVHEFERKAGFQVANDYYAVDTPAQPSRDAVAVDDVVDLTGKLANDGTLDWQVPPGDWVILRMGYSLMGKSNHAASRQGTGLEVDKLNRVHVTDYFDQYLSNYGLTQGTSGEGLPGLGSIMMDSYEIGTQNWTEDILAQFQRLRGYDPRPWLPALTGIIVGSAGDSDRFLWDFRKTLADLLIESHYAASAEIAADNGLQLYGEAMESMRWTLGDDMDMRRYADIPTAAIWAFPPGKEPQPGTAADIRGAASVAHVYGRDLVAVEALTSAMAPWAQSPRTLKPVTDLAFTLGMNRPIIHTSVHQPLTDARPGLTLSFFGQNFSRNETWAELAGHWMAYLARCAFLLQQGQHVADVAYFYGEEAPLPALFPESVPGMPEGTGFDFISRDALLNQLSVEDGLLVTPGGASYRLLYLGGSSARMTLPVLEKIRDLVAGGAAVAGNRPTASPSLADDRAAFEQLVGEIWGGDPGKDGAQANPTRVHEGETPASALERLGVTPDFDYRPLRGEPRLAVIHRRLAEGDLYFVSNRSSAPVALEAGFRVSGREAEFWDPQAVTQEKAPYRFEAGRTRVPMELDAHQSLFVVFLEKTDVPLREQPTYRRTVIGQLEEGWQLSFPGDAGEPAVSADGLPSWSDSDSDSVRYFSGTATYHRNLHVEPGWLEGDLRLLLDLGKVREFAEVAVNGEHVATLWAPPYRSDITDYLEPGDNGLEVRVTNLWANRLIGDSQPGAMPVTFTAIPAYTADAPLFPSGLLGPVTLEQLSPD